MHSMISGSSQWIPQSHEMRVDRIAQRLRPCQRCCAQRRWHLRRLSSDVHQSFIHQQFLLFRKVHLSKECHMFCANALTLGRHQICGAHVCQAASKCMEKTACQRCLACFPRVFSTTKTQCCHTDWIIIADNIAVGGESPLSPRFVLCSASKVSEDIQLSKQSLRHIQAVNRSRMPF